MGIPSYFSYIIRNHSNIIRNLKQLRQSESRGAFHSLYMDCNSIIYDAVNTSSETDKQLFSREYEELLISRVIAKINDIVRTIQPSNTLYIAFDGVAPFAKMNQQRVRRYKNAYMAAIDFHLNDGIRFKENNGISGKWSTSSITPGTRFMEKLSDRLSVEYSKGGKSSNSNTYDFSSSNVLWRATLKTLDFMPLLNVDYQGGVIIYDWYSDNDNYKEQIKVTVRFLNNQLRTDSINIVAHKKICEEISVKCKTIKLDDKFNSEIKDTILTSARA